jgi:putative redox protein
MNRDNEMANDLTVRAILDSGMCFEAETGSGHQLILDAAEQHGGEDRGPRPMEMLLVALATCAGMDILAILKKKRQEISGYEVGVLGTRTEEHPRIFVEIVVEHIFTGHAIQTQAVQRAIDLTEERYCGASAILRKSANLTHSFTIIEK